MDITKLPKWAQKHINDLDRKRILAERNLSEFLDGQTESSFYYDEYDGHTHCRRYVQTRGITIEEAGLEVRVFCPRGIQGRQGVEITFSPINASQTRAVIQPNASNSITIRKALAFEDEQQ